MSDKTPSLGRYSARDRVIDELLILSVLAGEQQAIDRLGRRWNTRLLRVAMHITGDRELAEIATQEAWVGIMVMLTALIIAGISFWFIWEAFRAESIKMVTLWACGAVCGLIGQGLLRIFLMSRMHMLAMMRELKRIELRLIKLDERLG